MATPNIPRAGHDAQGLSRLLASPEIVELITGLQGTRETGRPGYPIRAMVGMTLVKSLYSLPTWTRTVRLVAEHAGLRQALGCQPLGRRLLPLHPQAARPRRPAHHLHRLRSGRPDRGGS